MNKEDKEHLDYIHSQWKPEAIQKRQIEYEKEREEKKGREIWDDEFHPIEDKIYSLFSYSDNNLHQTKVHVFCRKEDYATKPLCVDQVTGEVTHSTLINPSPRRQGVIIEFMDEQFGSKSYLRIWQHKGETRFCYTKAERDNR